jgi:hypothetical protein
VSDVKPYDFPIRNRSVKGEPKETSNIGRSCRGCGASFLHLAPGKVGLRGVWHGWTWYCSHECAGEDFSGTDPEPFTSAPDAQLSQEGE